MKHEFLQKPWLLVPLEGLSLQDKNTILSKRVILAVFYKRRRSGLPLGLVNRRSAVPAGAECQSKLEEWSIEDYPYYFYNLLQRKAGAN